MFFSRLKKSSSDSFRILFIHIMKTAGTSFRRMLQEELGSENIFPSDRNLEKLPNGWYLLPEKILESYNLLPKHKVLIGHFPASIINKLPNKYSAAVFLRDPLQRSLSTIKHHSNLQNKSPEYLINDQDFLERYIKNYQTKILGMDLVVDPNLCYEIDEKILTNALARINQFEFVGITEKYEESCRVFDKTYKTNIASRIKRENVSRSEESELLFLKNIIQPLIDKDQILYEHALKSFNNSLKVL